MTFELTSDSVYHEFQNRISGQGGVTLVSWDDNLRMVVIVPPSFDNKECPENVKIAVNCYIFSI